MKRKHWEKELINLVIVGTGMLFTDKPATSVNGAGSIIKVGKDTKGEQATSCSPLYAQAHSFQILSPCGLHLHILTKNSPLLSQSCGLSLCLLKIA